MREILFRGKRIANGEWVYGNYCAAEYISGDGIEHLIIEVPRNGASAKIVSETVGQFTGLTDKNGKKIFEGDILESQISENPEDWKIWTVGFEDGTFTFESVRKSVRSRRKYRYEMNMICEDEVKFYGLVLVGNIHDNPELLKQKEE